MTKKEAVEMFKQSHKGMIENNPSELPTFWNMFLDGLFSDGCITYKQTSWKMPKL